MQLTNLLIGVAITLSVVAFVLALWPAVADAPWETQEVTVSVESQPVEVQGIIDAQRQLLQTDICLRLIEAEPGTVRGIVRGEFVKDFLIAEGRKLGCWE